MTTIVKSLKNVTSAEEVRSFGAYLPEVEVSIQWVETHGHLPVTEPQLRAFNEACSTEGHTSHLKWEVTSCCGAEILWDRATKIGCCPVCAKLLTTFEEFLD